mmetsp:Transcript_29681/g.62430  ORF Transcript_29681/g.62430 Transcript_29681/m.62430 type:complete len:345 (+) Transcript_29681:490-1524(+)
MLAHLWPCFRNPFFRSLTSAGVHGLRRPGCSSASTSSSATSSAAAVGSAGLGASAFGSALGAAAAAVGGGAGTAMRVASAAARALTAAGLGCGSGLFLPMDRRCHEGASASAASALVVERSIQGALLSCEMLRSSVLRSSIELLSASITSSFSPMAASRSLNLAAQSLSFCSSCLFRWMRSSFSTESLSSASASLSFSFCVDCTRAFTCCSAAFSSSEACRVAWESISHTASRSSPLSALEEAPAQAACFAAFFVLELSAFFPADSPALLAFSTGAVSEVAGAVSWVLCLLRFTPRAASTASSSIWPSPRFDISRFRERTVGIAIQGSALTCAVRRAEMLLRCT